MMNFQISKIQGDNFVWQVYGKWAVLYGERMAKTPFCMANVWQNGFFVWQAYGKTLFLAHFCMAKCHKNRESAAFFRTVKLGFTELLKNCAAFALCSFCNIADF
ncbi:hypothetical protein [Hominimerdicola sp. 21CYCFAH17_S]